MANWQQVLAADVKFNSYRAPSTPGFKTLYLRRRSQLLRSSHRFEDNPKAAHAYMQLRSSLLQQRYGISLDQLSQRSWGTSHRSASRLTMEGDSISSTPTMAFKMNNSSSSLSSASKPLAKGEMMPSYKAEASKAIVGGTSIVEHYEFSGVYHIFDQHKDSTTMVKFGHNDSTLLGCCSLDGNISICHLEKDDPKIIHKLQKHTAGVTAFDWSSSNDLIVSAGMDGLICLWNAETGQCLRSVPDQANAQLLSCIFHPLNSNWIVAGNSVGLLQVMNISTGLYPAGGTSQVPDAVTALTFDVSGIILWAGNAQGSINSFKFDISSGRLRKGKRLVVNEGTAITCLNAKTWANREARDPSLLVNCACNGLFLFRLRPSHGDAKHIIRSLSGASVPLKNSTSSSKSNSAYSLNRESSCLLLGATRPKFQVIWLRKLDVTAVVIVGCYVMNFVRVATKRMEMPKKRSERIVDNEGGLSLKRRIAIPHLSQQIQSTFSPIMSFRQGTCVVSGSEDCKVWIMDIGRESNPLINKLTGHPAPVLSVSFNYNETLLASSDASGLVIIWK